MRTAKQVSGGQPPGQSRGPRGVMVLGLTRVRMMN